MEPCQKLLGWELEFANSLTSTAGGVGDNAQAARRLLDEIAGYPCGPRRHGAPTEWGRRFLATNGGSAYIDLDHLEINLPEHARAADHAALVHAALRQARQAQVAASLKLPRGQTLRVMAHVSDGQSSWGHHLSVLMHRDVFRNLLTRQPHLAGFFATHLATSTIYTGQGLVGAGNGRPAASYQLSQRADWFEQFISLDTTQRRGLINCRDENHADPEFARMHVIYFDNVLCPVANHLKAGTTQLVLAMVEAGWADPCLQLADPLESALDVSRDLSLALKLPTAVRGRSATAVELQQELANLAGEFVASVPGAAVAVPGASEIVRLWRETLDLLARHEHEALAHRCDAWLKFLLLERHCARRGLSWQSADLRCLDLLYASLDPDEGLFLQLAAAGQVDGLASDGLASDAQIERCLREPPDDTRAYLRAHVLRRHGEHVSQMNWDEIRFRLEGEYRWAESVLPLADPRRFGRDESGPILDRSCTLHDLVEALGRNGAGRRDGVHAKRSGIRENSGGESVGTMTSGNVVGTLRVP